MRKMRGGGIPLDKGVNQTVDFIIKNGNNILVSKNVDVTGNDDFTIIGTFAKSSLYKKGENTLATSIEQGINMANDKLKEGGEIDDVKSKLVNLTDNTDECKTVVRGLLKKKLLNDNTSELSRLLDTIEIKPVNTEFHEVIGDVRLNKDDCANTNHKCIVLTQLFELDVSNDHKSLFSKDKFEWKPFLKDNWFVGHKNLLNKVM